MGAPNVDAPGAVTAAPGRGEQGTADAADCAAIERQRVAAHDQRLAQIRARASTKGFTLHAYEHELVFVWCGLSKALPSADLEIAERWLDHVGAPR